MFFAFNRYFVWFLQSEIIVLNVKKKQNIEVKIQFIPFWEINPLAHHGIVIAIR